MGVYPFMFGAIEDFEPIKDELVAVRNCSPLAMLSASLQTDVDITERLQGAIQLGRVCTGIFPNGGEVVQIGS